MNPNKTDWASLQREESQKAHREELRERDERLAQVSEILRETNSQLDVALAVNSKKPSVKPIPPAPVGDSEATAFAIASDWHVEETVKPESVNGLNEHNLTLADSKITRFFQSVLRLTEINRSGTRIDNLVLALLGDMMTGYIHEELQETNGLSPVETVVWLRDRILSGIQTLRKEGGFKRIIIPCSYGNHGRTTKKPRHATGYKNSYEWLLYNILAKDAELLGMTNVEWQIAVSYHTYLDVYGRVIRLHHGDGLRYEGGIGGLTIPVEKAIAAWNKGRVADLDIFGHWHTQQQNPKWISNGPLIGYNAFSIQIKAPFEPPQQTYFLFDSKRGRTGTWPLYLA